MRADALTCHLETFTCEDNLNSPVELCCRGAQPRSQPKEHPPPDMFKMTSILPTHDAPGDGLMTSVDVGSTTLHGSSAVEGLSFSVEKDRPTAHHDYGVALVQLRSSCKGKCWPDEILA